MSVKGCQYPLWDEDFDLRHNEAPYCGKPTRSGSSWCPECHARCHVSPDSEEELIVIRRMNFMARKSSVMKARK